MEEGSVPALSDGAPALPAPEISAVANVVAAPPSQPEPVLTSSSSSSSSSAPSAPPSTIIPDDTKVQDVIELSHATRRRGGSRATTQSRKLTVSAQFAATAA